MYAVGRIRDGLSAIRKFEPVSKKLPDCRSIGTYSGSFPTPDFALLMTIDHEHNFGDCAEFYRNSSWFRRQESSPALSLTRRRTRVQEPCRAFRSPMT